MKSVFARLSAIAGTSPCMVHTAGRHHYPQIEATLNGRKEKKKDDKKLERKRDVKELEKEKEMGWKERC